MLDHHHGTSLSPPMNTTPLTQSEDALLHNDGLFILQYVPGLMAETLAWAFHVYTVSFAVYTLRRKGVDRSRPKTILLATVLFMFLISTTLFTLHIYQFAIRVKGIYLTSMVEGQSLTEKGAPSAVLNDKAVFASDILFGFEFLIGDAVVLWRTWAVWSTHSIVILPTVLWISSFGCLLAWVITRVTQSIEPLGWANFNFGNDDPEFLLLTNYILSLAVNGVSTILIAYKAWEHRSLIKNSFTVSSVSTRAGKTLALLLESGMIYFVLFSIQLFNFVPNPNVSATAASIIASLGDQLLGLYPTLIIILVHRKQTIWDSPELSEARTTTAFTSVVTVDQETRRSYAEEGNSVHDDDWQHAQKSTDNTEKKHMLNI
ncbi:hypothetical protein BDP27DRAFT_1455281 [Rhodocollybia butyracea]|uniref:Uncharacterized protein n=1 Tax=Rhodocollybia butyracea TaxID=206335 RepID=A0A9P5P237_9AGAR|nr:hypothetical protein BDP27DRAFT_1455281 [Rhodocollybia butyracea]